MSQIITAVVTEGMLRPLAPLQWPEQTEVKLEVKSSTPPAPAPASGTNERTRIHRLLVEAGLVEETGLWQAVLTPVLASAEAKAAADAFALGKPLSEIIIEERQEGY